MVEGTSVCLGIVFQQEKMMFSADVSNFLRIGTPAVEMNDQNGFGSPSNGFFNQAVVYFQCIWVWFYQPRCKAVFGDG